jgi:AraC-like DNA-binding protein
MIVIVTFLLVLLTLVIRYHARLDTRARWLFLLSLALVCSIYMIIHFMGTDTAHEKWYLPLAYNISVLLFMPCTYLYSRAIILSKEIEFEDLRHVLPAVGYISCYVPVYFSPLRESFLNRIQLFETLNLNNYSSLFYFSYAYMLFWYQIVIIIYFLMQVNIIAAQLRPLYTVVKNKYFSFFKWVILLGAIQLFFFYRQLAGSYDSGTTKWRLSLVAVLVNTIVVVYVFFRKDMVNASVSGVLQGAGYESLELLGQQQATNDGEAERRHTLTNEVIFQEHHLARIEEKINKLMGEEKQFLKHGYSLRMLSDEMGISLHVLSAYINRRHKMNFNDFINEYRIKFCIEKIENGEWKQKTLEALSKESGFNNRNSFTLAFKKVTGVTPSNFLKQMKTSEVNQAVEIRSKGRVFATS